MTFFKDFVAPIANSEGDTFRKPGTGSNDSKHYKLTSIRRKYFASLMTDPKDQSVYTFLKNRFMNKLQYYQNVKVSNVVDIYYDMV